MRGLLANTMAVFTHLLDASPDSSLMQYFSSARQACESIEGLSQSEDSIEGSNQSEHGIHL